MTQNSSAAPPALVREAQVPAAPPNVPRPPAPVGGAIAPLAPAPKRKRGLRSLIFPLILLGGLYYGGNMAADWLTVGRFLIATDDAYVGADTAILSPKVAGNIADVLVVNNQAVKKDQVLVRIDAGDYKLAVRQADDKIASQDATVTRFNRQIDAQAALIAQADSTLAASNAQILSAEADKQRAELEFERAQKLAQTSFGSQQKLEQATADRARTSANVVAAGSNAAASKGALAWAKANLDVLKAQKGEAEHARAELVTAKDKAERDLSFTEIRAPFDGIVGNKAVEPGQYALPGTRLLAVVAPSTVFVDANFKETQIAAIKVGMKVDVAVDALVGRVVPGTVTSIAPASGAQFSLLPPENATGNFTKVVQRVAVRVTLDPPADLQGSLRPGLSVVVAIHTRDDNLPKLTLREALHLDAFPLQEFSLEALKHRFGLGAAAKPQSAAK